MQRLLILFLMFLLPLQVFAGGLDTRIAFAHQVESSQASVPHQQLRDVADLIAFENSASDDDCCVFDDESTEFNLHVDSGDEILPTYGFNFTPNLSSLSPALSNDNASDPPFLPLIAPPPRA